MPPAATLTGSGLDTILEVDGNRLAFNQSDERMAISAAAIADGGYAAWRLARFGNATDPMGAPALDPFGRGFANVVEYALGLDLLDTPYAGLPVTDAPGEIRFTRRPGGDVRLVVEAAATLDVSTWTAVATREPGAGAWTGVAAVDEILEGDVMAVTVHIAPIGEPAPERRFLRLRIEFP